jgi:AcrR family transcriptional regulator
MRALPGHALRGPEGQAPVTRAKLIDDQRQRILRATGELVAKRGYHGTTVELIVRRARVGYATFYKNFEGKEDCFLAFFDVAVAVADKRMKAAMEAAGDSWPERVRAGLQALFGLMAEEPLLARACVVESLTAGPKGVTHHEASLRRMVPMLRPGREFNPRRAELPETLDDTIAGGILWIAYQRLILNEADRLEAALPETLEFALSPYIGEEAALQMVGELTV